MNFSTKFMILLIGIFFTLAVRDASAEKDEKSNDSESVRQASELSSSNNEEDSKDQQECNCTPFNKCKSFVATSNGGNLIDIRVNMAPPCQSYMDVCCDDKITDHKKEETTNHNKENDTTYCKCNNKKEDSTDKYYKEHDHEKYNHEKENDKKKHEYATDKYKENDKEKYEYTTDKYNENNNEKYDFTTEKYKENNKEKYDYTTEKYKENNKEKHDYTTEKYKENDNEKHDYTTEKYKENDKENHDYTTEKYKENDKEKHNYTTEKYEENDKEKHDYTTEKYKENDKEKHDYTTEKYKENDEKKHEYMPEKYKEHNSTKEINEHPKEHKCGIWNKNGVGFRIINGIDNESQYGEYPSMVAIFLEKSEKYEKELSFHCGGSLIKKNVILTAVHCVLKENISTIVVRAGEWDLKTEKEIYSHQDRRVSKIITHPNYYAGGLHNDVALIFTDEPFHIQENVQTICLPEHDDNFDDSRCFSSGWGTTVSYNNYTIVKKIKTGKSYEIGKYQVNILKKVEVPIVSREICEKKLRRTRLGPKFTLDESFICAGGEEGQDTCKGDGGSPLMCPSKSDSTSLVQVGIVSWGIQCGLADIPAAYVNVARFRKWIDDSIALY